MGKALTILAFIWANYPELKKLIGGVREIIAVAMKVLRENRSIIDKIVKQADVSISKAETVVLTKKMIPHKMNRQEEEAWFKRASGDGQF